MPFGEDGNRLNEAERSKIMEMFGGVPDQRDAEDSIRESALHQLRNESRETRGPDSEERKELMKKYLEKYS